MFKLYKMLEKKKVFSTENWLKLFYVLKTGAGDPIFVNAEPPQLPIRRHRHHVRSRIQTPTTPSRPRAPPSRKGIFSSSALQHRTNVGLGESNECQNSSEGGSGIHQQVIERG